MVVRKKARRLFDGKELLAVVVTSFIRLTPLHQFKNPVMFIVYVGAVVTMVLAFYKEPGSIEKTWFVPLTSVWLWLTVLFSNFAETIAERRGKAQAESLRAARQDIAAKKLKSASHKNSYQIVPSSSLRKGDLVFVKAGDFIPSDSQVIEGVASVDESAITGESSPVIRENSSDRDTVTGGTLVLSDWLVIRITNNPGDSFLDKMIALVEGAKRQKTPNEIALAILLAGMTLIFLLVCATLLPYSIYTVKEIGAGTVISITVLIALLVCLAPTTISSLLSAIGIAGMNRLLRVNVVAKSGHAVEAAGDINVILLDKTGTLTYGNRQATAFYPVDGVTHQQLAEASTLASLADTTPEGKSIVDLAINEYRVNEKSLAIIKGTFVPFSSETRFSGITLKDRQILKGATDAIESHVIHLGGEVPASTRNQIEKIAREGGTPLLVCQDKQILGLVYLKDVIKHGIKKRLADLRRMGIKSIMVTGDNPLTSAAIAEEAGVDDYIAQATPQIKLAYIQKMQTGGELVAMVGDGTNDAPALAQSDVAVVMNSGTQAAKEAGNMIDLDSDPTKLIEIVKIGKQLLITRGALTTFSMANDIAKYFAIIPAAFANTYPALIKLNVMGLKSPESAILSAIIFNALIIIFLTPLALRGVKYRFVSTSRMLRRNVFIYGLGGIIVPFIGIKILDALLAVAGVS